MSSTASRRRSTEPTRRDDRARGQDRSDRPVARPDELDFEEAAKDGRDDSRRLRARACRAARGEIAAGGADQGARAGARAGPDRPLRTRPLRLGRHTLEGRGRPDCEAAPAPGLRPEKLEIGGAYATTYFERLAQAVDRPPADAAFASRRTGRCGWNRLTTAACSTPRRRQGTPRGRAFHSAAKRGARRRRQGSLVHDRRRRSAWDRA